MSVGIGTGEVELWDVEARQKLRTMAGHQEQIVARSWQDGELASGGNDNIVNIWDGGLGDVGEGARGTAKWMKQNHTAAVKCPRPPSLLASGSGTNDATIHIWSSITGARLHSLRTPSQVTHIIWALHHKEVMSTHGYPTNWLMLHVYPSMECVAGVQGAHDSRVLFSTVSPAGDVVVTGAGDENLSSGGCEEDCGSG